MSDELNTATDNTENPVKQQVARGANKDKRAAANRGKEAKAPVKKQAYMYLGPNLPGGILFTGSVYKEYPEHLNDVFE